MRSAARASMASGRAGGRGTSYAIIEAKEAMAKLNKGDGLEIEFDCTQATEAIPAWAAEEGYEVTNFEQIDDAKWSITVIK